MRVTRSCIERWLAMVLAMMFLAGPAQAAEVTLQDRIQAADKIFGEWFVDGLASVMFYDLVFWDNELPPDEAIGTRVGDELIVGHDEAGYHYRRRTTVPADALLPLIEAPVVERIGPLQIEVRLNREGGRPVPAARLLPAPIDPKILAERGVVADPDALEPIVLDGLAPFPVRLDPSSLIPLSDVVPVPEGALTVSVGSKALLAENGETVTALAWKDGMVEIEAPGERVDATPIANPHQVNLPAVVFWLFLGAIFFTFRMAFISVRGFGHAILVTAGHYDDPDDPGEITHFQALSSALSATVGLGNIAGVAIAIQVGGPGAMFWMVTAALFGMSSKFNECTLGQMYREVRTDGTVSGGPMHYLDRGLTEMGLGPLGKLLALTFALMCIGGSFGGGNMFQANQSFAAVSDVVPALRAHGEVIFQGELGVVVPEGTRVATEAGLGFVTLAETTVAPSGASDPVPVLAETPGLVSDVVAGAIIATDLPGLTVTNPSPTSGGTTGSIIYGLVLSFFVGLVIIGGIKRIGAAASIIVPVMCGVYVAAGLWILAVNASEVPAAFGHIFSEAWSSDAGLGGLIGTMIVGVQRASFSNEAGVGSAAIAHSAASTSEPVREGIVALLEPFIDTVIVCSMTGLVVVVTGAYEIEGANGVVLTSRAFESVISWFPLVLSFAVVMFAFSTMISWSYYGERCTTWLLGDGARLPYRVVFLIFVFLGSVFQLGNVLTFSDLMVLGMAFPNILGGVILSGKVKAALDTYMSKLQRGVFDAAR